MNRRQFIAGALAVPVAGQVTAKPVLAKCAYTPRVLGADGVFYDRLSDAMKHARPGDVVHLLPGHRESTNPRDWAHLMQPGSWVAWSD